MDSMSSGLIEFNGLRGSACVTLAMSGASGVVASFCSGTPSTTYSGSLLALIDVPPRMRICTPAPGSPLFCTICTPLTRPCIICVTLVMTPTFAADASIVCTDPEIASRR